MAKVKAAEKPFVKVTPTEYRITIAGEPRTIKTSFGLNELLFREFITGGGLINPTTGEITQDIMALISSFRPVGDILLTEFDDYGKVVVQGSTFTLGTSDLINLFMLASELIMLFIAELERLKEMQTSPVPNENESL
jgi:hypothetical protein